MQQDLSKDSAGATIYRGITAGMPLVLSYLPVAITFGVVAKQSGMSIGHLSMMSLFVYAGAAQFMGVNMISVGAGGIEIIIATFVLNFRHFIMSLSFVNRLRSISLKVKIPLTLGLTDETFAVASMHTEEADKPNGKLFYLALFLSAYLSWVIGTIIGGGLGDVIPEKLSESMGIALYAMFIALLIPAVKVELKYGLIAIFAMLVNALSSQFFSSGWSIVLGTLIGGFSGVFILQEDNK